MRKIPNENIIVYDIETNSANTDIAKLKFFGYYSYRLKQTGVIHVQTHKDLEKIKELLDSHDILVGFNSKQFDNPILERVLGVDLRFRTNVDLWEILAPRKVKGQWKSKRFGKGRAAIMKGFNPVSFKLDTIVKELGLGEKIDDPHVYKFLRKDVMSIEEIKRIVTYAKMDIVVTRNLFEYLYNYFYDFRNYLDEKNIRNFAWLTASTASFAYKAICHACELKEEYNKFGEGERFVGAFISEPKVEKAIGKILCLDFSCLAKNTKILTIDGEKEIHKLKIGDIIKTINNYDKIKYIKKKKVNGIYRVQTNRSEILLTPEHRMLVLNDDGTTSPKLGLNLKKGDNLIWLQKIEPHGIKGKNVQVLVNSLKHEQNKKIQIGEAEKKQDIANYVKKPLKHTQVLKKNIVQVNAQIKEEVKIHGHEHLKIEKNLVKSLNKELNQNQLRQKQQDERLCNEQNIENGEPLFLQEININAKNVGKKGDIYKLTIKKVGKNIHYSDSLFQMDKHSVRNVTEKHIKKTSLNGERKNDIFFSDKILNITFEEYNDFVYDITLNNQERPFFIANNLISHNSMYPHNMMQGNLFSSTCSCCTEEEKYKGRGPLKLKGSYCSKNFGRIEKQIREWYMKRLEYKKVKDAREYTIKILINATYGLTGNPVFKNMFSWNAASDCTYIGQQMIKFATQKFNDAGYTVLYNDTDSAYVQYDGNDERILKLRDSIVNEIKSWFPFPQDTFDMGIDDRIKAMFFLKAGEDSYKKKNYVYITEENKIVMKGLPLIKSNATKLTKQIYVNYLKSNILQNLDIKFPLGYLKQLIYEELNKTPSLIAQVYQIKDPSEYKAKTCLPAQIGQYINDVYSNDMEKPDIISLIPNNKIHLGKKFHPKEKSKGYCTFEDYKKFGLNVFDINLDKCLNELEPFILDSQKTLGDF